MLDFKETQLNTQQPRKEQQLPIVCGEFKSVEESVNLFSKKMRQI
jgi:hypothetical protein